MDEWSYFSNIAAYICTSTTYLHRKYLETSVHSLNSQSGYSVQVFDQDLNWKINTVWWELNMDMGKLPNKNKYVET